MHIHIDGADLEKQLPVFFLTFVLIGIIVYLFTAFIKWKESLKPVQTVKAEILEKPFQRGDIAWYVIQCEDGSRLRLRSFKEKDLIITVGDIGIISYKGKTIQKFQREE